MFNTTPISLIQFLERPPMNGDQPQSDYINNINTLINMRFWAQNIGFSENHNFRENGKPKDGINKCQMVQIKVTKRPR